MLEDYRAFVFDLNGTLSKAGSVSDAIKQRVDEWSRHVEIFVATGRPPQMIAEPSASWMRSTVQSPWICSNGNCLYDPQTHESSYTRTFSSLPVWSLMDRYGPTIGVAVEASGRLYVSSRSVEVKIAAMGGPANVEPIANLQTSDVSWIVVFPDSDELQSTIVSEPCGDARWRKFPAFRGASLSPKGVTKSDGLVLALQERDYSVDEVVAFGDGWNDESMLDACGLGVAVERHHPTLAGVAKVSLSCPLADYLADELKLVHRTI